MYGRKNALKEYRRRYKLSLQDIAEQFGVEVQFISDIENGLMPIPLYIAEELGIN